MSPKHPDYPIFKKEFWEWFDSLTIRERKAFQFYKFDIAETNFYFKIWSKRLTYTEI